MKKQTKLGLVLAAAAVISVSVASLVSARGWVQNGADWYYVDNNNEYVTDTIQASGTAKFYLGEDGAMQRDYFLEEYNGNTYYFGQNGAMVTNTWVAIESSRVENQDDYVPDNYWYYFQSSGKAMRAASGKLKITTIDGKKYGFNEYAQLCTGWITSDGKVVNPDDESNPFSLATYYAGGDNDGVLRAGWLTYYDGYDGDSDYHEDKTNLYFWFNTSNNKKFPYDSNRTKKINGRTYAFDSDGVMLSGWDVYRGATGVSSLTGSVRYFSTDDDGHQVKKGWVYAVPAEGIDAKAYSDDEEKYMYFNASGIAVNDQIKKINNKHYVFARNGIMKTGLVIWAPSGVTVTTKADNPDTAEDETETALYHYIDKIDLDWATGEEIVKKGMFRYDSGENQYIHVNKNGAVISGGDPTRNGISLGTSLKLHLFGDDGARKTGANNIEFADDTFTLQSNNGGDRGSGSFSKKYYSLGIQCKASPDIRYGIYNNASDSDSTANNTGYPLARQSTGNGAGIIDTAFRTNLKNGVYLVLTTSGSKLKGGTNAKKDADGNYWLVDADSQALKGIWTQNVKSNSTISAGLATRTQRLDAIPARLVNGRVYSTASVSELTGDGTFMWTGVANTALANMTWKAVVDTNTHAVSFLSNAKYVGYAYQSDIGEGSNKWIPFGVVDNSGKTIIDDPEIAHDKGLTGYEVKPTNDYFLNCYWE